jgi:hypothetical protein
MAAKITLFVCTTDEADTMETWMGGGSSFHLPLKETSSTEALRRAARALCQDACAYRGDAILPIFCTFSTSMMEEEESARRRKASRYAAYAQALMKKAGLHVSLVNTCA